MNEQAAKTETDQQELIRLLQQTGALLKGNFLLASGLPSTYYLDSKKVSLNPKGALVVAKMMTKELDQAGIRHVCGTAYGGIPLVSHIVLYSAIREGGPIYGLYNRTEVRTHGTMENLEGNIPGPGTNIAIVEDVVTTGQSLMKAAETAEKAGLLVTMVLVLADRNQGGRKMVENAGYIFRPLITLEQPGG